MYFSFDLLGATIACKGRDLSFISVRELSFWPFYELLPVLLILQHRLSLKGYMGSRRSLGQGPHVYAVVTRFERQLHVDSLTTTRRRRLCDNVADLPF